MPPMKPFFSSLLSVPLLVVIILMGGCGDKSPSGVADSTTPVVPPFASPPADTASTPAVKAQPAATGPTAADPMAAIQQARDRVNKNPKDLQALVFLANANFDIQRYQEAADLYQKALELNSDNPQLRTDRATALYHLGRPKEAIEELKLALASDYHHENALYNMGIIKLAAFNDREGAIAAWTQLKDITQDQKLITDLDKRIADARQPASKASKASAGSSGAGGATESGGKAGTLQLPASSDHPK